MRAGDLYQTLCTPHQEIPSILPDNSIYKLYEEYALYRLSHFIADFASGTNDELTLDQVQALKLHLSEYFYFLKETPLLATTFPGSRLSTALLCVAKALEKELGGSRFQYLFPTLSILEYDCSTTQLKDPELQLHEFILDDDQTAIIQIADCLEFAEQDGLLKHLYTPHGQIKLLSEEEIFRLMAHSSPAATCYKLIRNKQEVIYYGESYGAALTRLKESLYAGGQKRDHIATENKAGASANEGIAQFFSWYEDLTWSEKLWLAWHKKTGLSDSLGTLLSRLQQPNIARHQSNRYCVEIIAGNIEQILVANPNLYHTFPKHVPFTDKPSIKEINRRLSRAYGQLAAFNKTPSFDHFNHTPEQDQFFCQNFAKLTDTIHHAATSMTTYFGSITRLIAFLELLKPEQSSAFLNYLQPLLDFHHYTLLDFKLLYDLFPQAERKAHVVQLFSEPLCLLIKNALTLSPLLTVFKWSGFFALLNQLREQNITCFSQHAVLENVLAKASPSYFRNVVFKLNQTLVLDYQERGIEHLFHALAMQPRKQTLLLMALAPSLSVLITSMNKLYQVNAWLDKKNQARLLTLMKQHHVFDRRFYTNRADSKALKQLFEDANVTFPFSHYQLRSATPTFYRGDKEPHKRKQPEGQFNAANRQKRLRSAQ